MTDIKKLVLEEYPVNMGSIGDEKEWDMNEQYREAWIEGYNKALIIQLVSQHREQLIDFSMKRNKAPKELRAQYEKEVDEYLKLISCG